MISIASEGADCRPHVVDGSERSIDTFRSVPTMPPFYPARLPQRMLVKSTRTPFAEVHKWSIVARIKSFASTLAVAFASYSTVAKP